MKRDVTDALTLKRIREGGRIGGTRSGEARRARRLRYESGLMSRTEALAYEMYLRKCREAGRRGGERKAEAKATSERSDKEA